MEMKVNTFAVKLTTASVFIIMNSNTSSTRHDSTRHKHDTKLELEQKTIAYICITIVCIANFCNAIV